MQNVVLFFAQKITCSLVYQHNVALLIQVHGTFIKTIEKNQVIADVLRLPLQFATTVPQSDFLHEDNKQQQRNQAGNRINAQFNLLGTECQHLLSKRQTRWAKQQ